MQPTELKQLPDWLLEQLPQITEPAILSLRDTKLVVTYPDRMEAIHESLKDVQHQIHHVKPTDLQILPEVYQYFGKDKESGGLFFLLALKFCRIFNQLFFFFIKCVIQHYC